MGMIHPDDLHAMLPRGTGGEDTLPSAHWYPWQEVSQNATFNPDKNMIPLGRFWNRIIGTDSDQLQLLLANSRSGKSVSDLIPLILLSQNNKLIFDFKTEFSRITLRWLKKQGWKVVVLDASDMVEDYVERYCSSYNPLSIIDLNSKRLIEDLALIAEALIIRSPSAASERFFDDNAAMFIKILLLHIVTFYERKFWTLNKLRELLSAHLITEEDGEEFKGFEALEIDMRGNLDPRTRSLVAAGAEAFFSKEDKEKSAIMSTCQTHTAFLDFWSIQDLVEDPVNPDLAFQFSDLKNDDEKLVIFVSISVEQMLSCMGYLRCLVSIAMSQLERVKKKPKRTPVILLDEFPSMGKMPLIQKYAGFSIGVKLIIVTQTIDMLKELYGKGYTAFTQGMIVTFGLSDDESLEFIQKRLGKLFVLAETESTSYSSGSGNSVTPPDNAMLQHGVFGIFKEDQAGSSTHSSYSRSTNKGWHYVDLLTTAEMSTLFGRYDPGMQIIINPGDPPIWCERLVYYDDPEFEGMWDE